jgi:hypothetical protein
MIIQTSIVNKFLHLPALSSLQHILAKNTEAAGCSKKSVSMHTSMCAKNLYLTENISL